MNFNFEIEILEFSKKLVKDGERKFSEFVENCVLTVMYDRTELILDS